MLALDLGRREAGRQGAASHHMRRADLVGGAVKIHEVAGANIDGADTESHCPRVDQIEMHQTFERRSQRCNVVIAQRLRRTVRIEERRRHTRLKKPWRAADERAPRAHLIDDAVGELVPALQPGNIRHAKRRCADRFPELAQPLDTLFRRIPGDQGRVDRADRNASDPVRVQVRFGQGLVDAGLVGAERAAALQDQCDALEGRSFGDDMRFPSRRAATSGVIRQVRTQRLSAPREAAPALGRARASSDASNPPNVGSGHKEARLRAVDWAFYPAGQADDLPIASSLR